MIKFIIHLLFYLLGIVFSFAQVTNKEISLNNQKIKLPGTLSYTSLKSPLIIWVHGSGNIDRNGNQSSIIKANYIQQFREKVAKKGIAFFSYDKRTAVKENFENIKDIKFEDLVNDVEIIINYFKTAYNFSDIILVGHSQGSLTGILASGKVDKFISVSGVATSIDETIIAQIKKNAPFLSEVVVSHFKELKETGKIQEVNPLLENVLSSKIQPFLISWMKYEPIKEIKKLKIPILIVNGDKDLQVKIEEAQKLHKSNENSKIKIVNKMNHVLKRIEKEEDNMKSYYSEEYPISEELIETIVTFIRK